MAKVPEGWELLIPEENEEEAWRLAVEFKEAREAVRGDLFVRTRVVPSWGSYGGHGWIRGFWVLVKEETRGKVTAT